MAEHHGLDAARRTAAGKSSRSRRSSASSAAQTFETAASVPAVAVEPAAPLAASTSFAETASVEPANADTPNRRGSDRSTDASGTPIGEIRDRSERVRSSLRRGRESEASEYSCAYELDLDDLDEGCLLYTSPSPRDS